jgi:hypothetical protein
LISHRPAGALSEQLVLDYLSEVGLVLHDVGLKTYDIDDNLIVARGPHPIALDFEAAFQKVCAAFEKLGA